MAEGIEVRHAKGCRSLSSGRCSCTPSYRVRVWSNREQQRVRKSFTSLAEAKAWRAEALVALRQGTLRAPVPQTVRAAAAAWLKGAREGTVRDRSGRSYKPSTIRTYAEKLDAYVLPALGDFRLSELRRPEVQALADQMLAAGLASSTVRNAMRSAASDLPSRDPTRRSGHQSDDQPGPAGVAQEARQDRGAHGSGGAPRGAARVGAGDLGDGVLRRPSAR